MTRRLCAATHLDGLFARQVYEEFTADRLTATGLPLGIHLVALVRHARQAVLRDEERDWQLAWLFAGLWVAAGVAVYGIGSGSPTVRMSGGCGIAAVLGAAWWVVHRAASRATAAALRIHHGSEEPKNLAPPAPPEVEAWLKELRRPNVMPYTASAERTNPFVGSGTKIKEAVWQPIDVSRPATAPGGGTSAIKPFDAVDLHTYVAQEMAKIAGLEGLRAQNRLYVRGDHVRMLGPDLLPDPLGRPLAQIAKPLVKAGLVQPGAGMRTYLSLERVGEGGRVIVSMHLRARLQQPSLSWEVAAYAIPPLDGRFDAVGRLPVDGFERRWSLFTGATRRFWPALRGAPGRLRRRRAARARAVRALDKIRRDISKRHANQDYGAVSSLRENVASWRALGHAERTDSQDFLHRLQQGVLIATERFLKDHNVDTSSFDQAQQVINTQTYNFSGDITGASNFGNNGQIAFGQGPQHPAPGGAPAAQP